MKTLTLILLLAFAFVNAKTTSSPTLPLPANGTGIKGKGAETGPDSTAAVIQNEINIKLQQQAYNNQLIAQLQRQLDEARAVGFKLMGAVEALQELKRRVQVQVQEQEQVQETESQHTPAPLERGQNNYYK
jgi:hypothetical protein